MNYLGHVVGRHGISPQRQRVDNIVNAPTPKSRKELQSFLGVASNLRNFVPKYAAATAVLLDLLKKSR